jgi:hypothetical protein
MKKEKENKSGSDKYMNALKIKEMKTEIRKKKRSK